MNYLKLLLAENGLIENVDCAIPVARLKSLFFYFCVLAATLLFSFALWGFFALGEHYDPGLIGGDIYFGYFFGLSMLMAAIVALCLGAAVQYPAMPLYRRCGAVAFALAIAFVWLFTQATGVLTVDMYPL